MVINFKGFGLEVDLSSHEYHTFKVTEDTGGKGNPQANNLGNTYIYKYPSECRVDTSNSIEDQSIKFNTCQGS